MFKKTPYEDIFQRFKAKIKNKKDFFFYKGLDDRETNEIINSRCLDLLDSAVDEMENEIIHDINFNNRSEIMEQFNFKLTRAEIDLISDKMVIMLDREEELKLQTMQNYLGSGVKISSPNNERKSIAEISKKKEIRYKIKLDEYNSRDRETRKNIYDFGEV